MKDKVNGHPTKSKLDSEASKFDAIKDILFGENIQNYDKEFEAVKKDILSKRQELSNLIAETEKDLNTALDSLSTDINIRITTLEDKLENKLSTIDENKIDRELLGDLLIKLGQKISK